MATKKFIAEVDEVVHGKLKDEAAQEKRSLVAHVDYLLTAHVYKSEKPQSHTPKQEYRD